MNREDLIILDQIRKVIKTNAKQNYETDMEETKDDGDTNSSISKQQASEESLNYKFNVFGQLQFLETAKQIIGQQFKFRFIVQVQVQIRHLRVKKMKKGKKTYLYQFLNDLQLFYQLLSCNNKFIMRNSCY
ncbi:unnamed protein product [Paramecium sonneborni]|uniref:Uncharacterized protein n=1 Tax=Paramecium sonneborni TaxID=65129 RepID=A0A8S1PI49_9CILI|nr:unnamed protein product [Paramecium sonneborni]